MVMPILEIRKSRSPPKLNNLLINCDTGKLNRKCWQLNHCFFEKWETERILVLSYFKNSDFFLGGGGPLGYIRYLNQLHRESISLFCCFKSWSVYHMLSGASDFYIVYCIFVYPLSLRNIRTLIQSSLSLGEINADHSYSRDDLC